MLFDPEAGAAGVQADADVVAGILKAHQQPTFAGCVLHIYADADILSRPSAITPDRTNAAVGADPVALALVANLPAGTAQAGPAALGEAIG
jgi:hypothetical protein